MNPDLKDALAAQLLAMADDELILGHRDSEWCGHAPILEEDIAFANIALDEIGHAVIWYSLLADLRGEDRDVYPNRLVYHRDLPDFRCAQLVEYPKGDWAFSMLRQYLFDAYEKVLLDCLMTSKYPPLAEAAAKMRPEEIYHLRHTQAWVRRLGLGTAESNRRMQAALEQLWPEMLCIFEPLPAEKLLVEEGYLPDRAEVYQQWSSMVTPFLHDANLQMLPPSNGTHRRSRHEHSPHLKLLLDSLQEVARLYPDAGW
jgi:ring-1,2-phenylacetyl-CoA epoxidase subunit PaaC